MRTPDLMDIFSSASYRFLYRVVSFLRFLFIVVMTVYLFSCLSSLAVNLFVYLRSSGFYLSYESMRQFLTDALFVLVILDFVSAMFYSKRIHYVLTLLEIGFIVVMRKLILLTPTPENSHLIFVLSLAASVFFILIFYFYKVTGRLRKAR